MSSINNLLATALIQYALPNGTIVLVPYDVCKAASVITYTLKGGRIVDAVIVRGER